MPANFLFGEEWRLLPDGSKQRQFCHISLALFLYLKKQYRTLSLRFFIVANVQRDFYINANVNLPAQSNFTCDFIKSATLTIWTTTFIVTTSIQITGSTLKCTMIYKTAQRKDQRRGLAHGPYECVASSPYVV
jgi:hypothetical protein